MLSCSDHNSKTIRNISAKLHQCIDNDSKYVAPKKRRPSIHRNRSYHPFLIFRSKFGFTISEILPTSNHVLCPSPVVTQYPRYHTTHRLPLHPLCPTTHYAPPMHTTTLEGITPFTTRTAPPPTVPHHSLCPTAH